MVNNYRVVFSDVDGTLLNKDRELSDVTVQQIRKLANIHNVKFVMVSARMPEGMQHLYNQLSIDSPIICYNGALILSSLATGFNPKYILHSNSIEFAIAEDLLKKATAENLHFGLFSNNNWYANRVDKWTLKEENNTRVKCTITQKMEELIADHRNKNLPIHKLMVMGDTAIIDSFIQFANQQYGGKITNYRSKDNYIEISPVDSNKANGCQFILNWMKASSNQAIAFGDNFNDIGMIKAMGLGIAMENAAPEVKSIADKIAPSHLSDGVAHTLSTIFD
ncbi:MAG: HAD family hydrolase [Bacteroidales bacterium]|nr:HAD family hydrolase [Bacteroidales bacterium]